MTMVLARRRAGGRTDEVCIWVLRAAVFSCTVHHRPNIAFDQEHTQKPLVSLGDRYKLSSSFRPPFLSSPFLFCLISDTQTFGSPISITQLNPGSFSLITFELRVLPMSIMKLPFLFKSVELHLYEILGAKFSLWGKDQVHSELLWRAFPGGPVVRAQCFPWGRRDFNPWPEN